MSKLAQISVGQKRYMEVDANPAQGLGLAAPIGSVATSSILGVGYLYLKSGPLATDWTVIQTGVDAPAWKFVTDPAQLNEALAASYFGTKSGDFDIVHRRNDVEMMRFENDQISINADSFHMSGAGNLSNINEIYASASHLKISASNGTKDLILQAGRTVIQTAQSAVEYLSGNPSALKSRVAEQRQVASVVVDDVDATGTLTFTSLQAGEQRSFKLTMFLDAMNGLDVADSMYEKTVHVGRDNSVVLVQDDFTSVSSFAPDLAVVITNAVGVLSCQFTGLAALTDKMMRIKCVELVNTDI